MTGVAYFHVETFNLGSYISSSLHLGYNNFSLGSKSPKILRQNIEGRYPGEFSASAAVIWWKGLF
jgi:hypothetical protein